MKKRNAFVNSKRGETWGHPEVVRALKQVVGNKCWYSEVSLDGSDPEVDHFRPKGRVVEVDANSLEKTGRTLPAIGDFPSIIEITDCLVSIQINDE